MLVLIERLGSDFENMRSIVQRARERMLVEGITAKSHRNTEIRLIGRLEASERTKDDALALLQQLGLTAMVLDERGRITFATDRTLEMLGIADEGLLVSLGTRFCHFAKKIICWFNIFSRARRRLVPSDHSVWGGLAPNGLSWRSTGTWVIQRDVF